MVYFTMTLMEKLLELSVEIVVSEWQHCGLEESFNIVLIWLLRVSMRRLGQSECINFFSLEKAVNFLFFNLNSKKSKLRSICLITHNAARMIKLWFNTAILYLADCLQLSYLMCGNPCVQNKNIVL